MHQITAFEQGFHDELSKLAGKEVVLHKDAPKTKGPEVIDTTGRTVGDSKKRTDRFLRNQRIKGMFRRGLGTLKQDLKAGPIHSQSMGVGASIGAGLLASQLGKKRRNLQREYDDLNTKDEKSRKRYTESNVARGLKAGGGYYAAIEGLRGVGKAVQRRHYRNQAAKAGKPMPKGSEQAMRSSIRGSMGRAAAGLGLAAGASLVDRYREKKRRERFQKGLLKKEGAMTREQREAIESMTGRKVPKDFKPSEGRAMGRGALYGMGAATLGAAAGHLLHDRHTGGYSESEIFGRRIRIPRPESTAGKNIGGYAGGLGGSYAGIRRSYLNQLKEHDLKTGIDKLKKKHGTAALRRARKAEKN